MCFKWKSIDWELREFKDCWIINKHKIEFWRNQTLTSKLVLGVVRQWEPENSGTDRQRLDSSKDFQINSRNINCAA